MPDADNDARKWDGIHAGNVGSHPHEARVLQENLHLLPVRGHALDLACGRGGNAMLLARHGLVTEAWDVSPVALAEVQSRATAAGVGITTRCVDVAAHPPGPGKFDVIVVSRFLARTIAPDLASALAPGGLLFYQTFIQGAPDPVGPSNTAYRLRCNELLRLFPSLEVLVYREEGQTGNSAKGFRNEAMFVGRRPG